LHALGEHLRLVGDPDWKIYAKRTNSFASGIRSGANSALEFTPAVYEKKVRWRKYELDKFDPWKIQSQRVLEKKEQLEVQLGKEFQLGRMLEVGTKEARHEWGATLRLASLAILDKSDGTVRVIHDGTHGIHVNPVIKVMNQTRCPGVAEKKVVMQKVREADTLRFGLKGDVEGAHRLVKVSRKDWGSQAFELEGTIYVNTVGTQGIGSAAQWWSRLVGGIARLVLGTTQRMKLWQLIYADDFEWTAHGPGFEGPLVFAVYFLEVVGLPFSWRKFLGGLSYEWVGFWTDWETFMVGISEKRAIWVADWCQKKLDATSILMQELTEVLGRLVFATQAVEHVKPLLGPLFAWTAAVPSGAFVELPLMVRLIFKLLIKIFRDASMRMVEVSRASVCKNRRTFRADARAEGDTVEAGGWETSGAASTKEARWFTMRLTRENAAWAFHAGEPYRSIASIELFTTLVAAMVFRQPDSEGLLELSVMDGETDNKGNAYVVAKLMTTKYPLNIILMELAMQLRKYNSCLSLAWVPREQNIEADELSNGVTRNFDAKKEIVVNVAELEFLILPELMDEARVFYGDLLKKKEARKRGKEGGATAPKRKLDEKLRARDPW
jgi:hypothetical protein